MQAKNFTASVKFICFPRIKHHVPAYVETTPYGNTHGTTVKKHGFLLIPYCTILPQLVTTDYVQYRISCIQGAKNNLLSSHVVSCSLARTTAYLACNSSWKDVEKNMHFSEKNMQAFRNQQHSVINTLTFLQENQDRLYQRKLSFTCETSCKKVQ